MASVLARTKPEEARKRLVARLLPLSSGAAIARENSPNSKSNGNARHANDCVHSTTFRTVDQAVAFLTKNAAVPATFALSIPSCQASRCTRAVK